MTEPRKFKPLPEWGVRELARETGISPSTATRVKRGNGDFDADTLRAVLSATGHCLCCGRSHGQTQAENELQRQIAKFVRDIGK